MAKWIPPASAKKVDPPPMAEFHRWQSVGDAVLGIVHRYDTNSFGDFVELSPAIVVPVKGKPMAVGSIAVGLSGNLKPKLPQSLVMRPVGITFADKEARAKGTLYVFDVHQLESEYFNDALTKMGADYLVGIHRANNDPIDDESEDALPF